ncbi:hypothetical protein [Leptospirillum ferriphilum]|uniref:Uncharacterized protein n=2 Tax=Leptospirillum ferriphilum TaxID=178606 RepID=A0A1V3SVQ9_9BACT|nr:hypothetical protein [Leptospirillum ferriphilum]AFS52754.1 hypothetical protein LFML04_0517 [Leptospirillum ferriphilum ML-04]OOH72909.1 hypothetical protein BOX24_05875 [Leptospirillum ferriphilum]OOH82295.1 hypothetical protein BOX30_03480 [Leptospirillum ferriphilum]
MSENQWLRLYNGILDDPKVQSLPGEIFKFWINVLCVASKNDGIIRDIPFYLRMPGTKVWKLMGDLRKAGLIDEVDGVEMPHNWNGRQYRSDNSTERVRKHREKIRRNVPGNNNETFHGTVLVTDRGNVASAVSETPPDTDTETKENELTCQSVVFLENEKEPTEELSTRLRNAGFSPKDATTIIRKYPSDRISMVLEYAKNKNLSSLRGFVFKALREEWSLSGISQFEMDPYQKDLHLWKSLPYEKRRKFLNEGGFGSNSDYPEPGWLRKVLEKIGSAS